MRDGISVEVAMTVVGKQRVTVGDVMSSHRRKNVRVDESYLGGFSECELMQLLLLSDIDVSDGLCQ